MSGIEERPESSSSSIVALGSFNPLILRPDWLRDNQLISEEAASNAEIQIIHPDIVEFRADGIHYQATSSRVSIGTTAAGATQVVRDNFAGIFAILESTPIRSFGLNLDQHFKCVGRHAWSEISSGLAPKTPWCSLIGSPSLQAIEVRGDRDADKSPSIKIAVEPSDQVSPGIFIKINEHYDAEQVRGTADKTLLDTIPTPLVVDVVAKAWEDFQRFALAAPKTLVEAALNNNAE